MSTIFELFGPNTYSRVTENMLVERGNYKISEEHKLVHPELIVGLELEIEDFPLDIEQRFRGLSFTVDNSLRNNGVEAITRPTYSKFVPEKLTAFFEKFKITERNYTERCSTHVHVNCQDLTPEQIAALCVLYQTVEHVLFSFIEHERDNNIFCVPWSQTNIGHQFVHNFLYDPNFTTYNWQKYTALNIIPLRTKGTVEFRHLEGTCDVKRITLWLNIIGSMFKYIETVDKDTLMETISRMNTISNYEEFIYSVFGEYAYVFKDLRENLAQGVVACKLLMLGHDKKKEDKPKINLNAEYLRVLDEYINNSVRHVRVDAPNTPTFTFNEESL